MAEAAFSEDGKYYSAISQDGRLRIWDTETNVLKQEYTPDLHLTSPPSCLQWITVATSATSGQKSKRKLSGTGAEAQCIAVGTTSGKILIYSVAQAKVETVLDDGNGETQNMKVTCLDWTRENGLFSCHKTNVIFEWKLDSNKKLKYNVNTDNKNKQVSTISAMKIIPHSMDTNAHYVVTASWQLRVWRLHDGTATNLKCLGHNASQQSILAIARTSEKTWVVEGSQTERLLSFWDVTITPDAVPQTNGEEPTPKKKQRKKSLSSIEVQTVTIPTYNFVLEDAPKMIDVVAVEDGETKLTLAAATRSGVVHYYGHTLNGASKKPIKPTLTVHVTTVAAAPLPLAGVRLGARLLLAYSHGAALVFEHVTPDLSSKTQVLIRGDAKPTKSKTPTTNEVNKVVSESSKDVQYVEPMGGVTRKRAAPGAKLEVPMEARLANLALDPAERAAGANQNLTRLLMQGLHSKDKSILELVLAEAGRAAAARSAAQLPPQYLPALLEQLTALAAKRTYLCSTVCAWVSAILRAHAALLLAAGAPLADQLTTLLATFTNRRAHLVQLLNLRGRLELTLGQRAARAPAADLPPAIDYTDTSDEEMEVERQSNASDASWDDEQFEESADEDEDEGGDKDKRHRRDRRDMGDSDSEDSGGSE